MAPSLQATARVTGVLYACIVVCGIFGEVGVREQLVDRSSATATAGNILASPNLFLAGFVSDIGMIAADVAVAVLFHSLLSTTHATLSLAAMAFRLLQAATLAVNLLNHLAAWLIVSGATSSMAGTFDTSQRHSLVLLLLDVQQHGYDLGLVFFGINCILTGLLLRSSALIPGPLAWAVLACGPVYIVGSLVRFVAPQWHSSVEPAYLLPFVAETFLAVYLIAFGVRTVTGRNADRKGQ